MSEMGMQILHSRNFLPGLKHVDLKFCLWKTEESQIPQSWERKEE